MCIESGVRPVREKEGAAISFVSEIEEDRFMDIERLINQEVKILDLPEKLEISQLLLEEEQVQTNNIVLPTRETARRSHAKKAKNTYCRDTGET